MNIPDLVILLVLACALVLAARRVYKNKKRGCSCGCAVCSACRTPCRESVKENDAPAEEQ